MSLVLLSGWIACGPAPSGQDSEAPLPGQARAAVSWHLDLRGEDLPRDEDGAWRLAGAGGEDLRVDVAWLHLTAMALEPCDALTVAPLGLGWVPEARAHGLPAHASATPSPQALDLRSPGLRDLGERSFAPERFCAVALAFYRADGGTPALPEGGWLADATLDLSGRWREGEGDWQPLRLTTNLPVERDLPLPAEGVDLTLTLDPAALDGVIDPHEHPERAALAALVALVDGASL